MNKKGQAALHLVMFMVSLFVVGLIYVMFSPAFRTTMDSLIPTLDTDDQPTANRIYQVWWAWPIGITVFLLLELFIKIMRNNTGVTG